MHWNFDNLENPNFPEIPTFSNDYCGLMAACSAGIDSTVLLHILCDLAKRKKNIDLAVCHINFGLRGEESEEDESYLRDLCRAKNVPIHVHRVEREVRLTRQGESVQEWARRLRYEVFASFPNHLIVLAHNENDLAENVLLRMARGSSTGELAGMSSYHPPYWRPLLKTSRKKIAEYASQHRISYREDSSNSETRYARNRIRHDVLPILENLYPGATHRIAEFGNDVRDVASFAVSHAAKALSKPATLDHHRYRVLPQGLRREVLGRFLKKNICDRQMFARKTLDFVDQKIMANESCRLQLSSTFTLQIQSDESILTMIEASRKIHRSTQHLRTLHGSDQTLYLPAGAKLRCLDPDIAIENTSRKQQTLRIWTPASREKMTFDKNYEIRELMQLWEIPETERFKIKAVSWGKTKNALLLPSGEFVTVENGKKILADEMTPVAFKTRK